MAGLMDEWRARKAGEDVALHERLCGAIEGGGVQLFTDPHVLDRPGSPVHSPWDQLLPLLALMLLALVILLAAGVAVGIVAMTVGALLHLTCTRYLVAWRLRQRTRDYMLASAAHWQAVWQLGGVAVILAGTAEAPCYAPLGDWRKFARRNLAAPGEVPAPPLEPEPEPAPPPVAVVLPPEPPPPPPVAPEPEIEPPPVMGHRSYDA